MSPVAQAGTRGYSDGQRVANFDSALLWNTTSTLGSGAITGPVLAVSRFAYLGGLLGCTTANCTITITWYTDAAATISAGSRTLFLSSSIGNLAQVRLPNLGPYVQALVNSMGGVSYVFTAKLFGTNRVHPLEMVPANPTLVDQQSVSIAGSTTVTQYPSDYYSGPLEIASLGTAGNFQVIAQYLTTNNTWDNFMLTPALPSTSWDVRTITVPGGAWRLQFNNQAAGAGAFSLIATPSMTGG